MGILSRAGDLVYTFRFLKLLVTKFEDTDAYKLGIIDVDGKRIKTKNIESSDEKSAFTTFHRLVFNIKKLLAKVPGGGSKLASYVSALFLLKEHFGVTENNLEKILKESGVDMLDLLQEQSEWFVMQDQMIAPGIYRVKNEKLLSDSLDERVAAKDKIRVSENSYPIDELFGINVYEGQHLNTGKTIHFTLGEIYK
jgi:hypothetical protein